jgi:hypothetical protein
MIETVRLLMLRKCSVDSRSEHPVRIDPHAKIDAAQIGNELLFGWLWFQSVTECCLTAIKATISLDKV